VGTNAYGDHHLGVRPEDNPDEWRRRIASAVRIEGVAEVEAAQLTERFATIYVEKGGRRCLDDSTPVIELIVSGEELDFTFENETWTVVECPGPEARAEAIESLAADSARESRLWW